jgi:hypothetical protein
MTLIEAAKQALEALEAVRYTGDIVAVQTEANTVSIDDAITGIRGAIAEAEKQEPVAWLGLEPSNMPDGDDPMYDHDFFLKGMAWADAILRKKNATPPAAQQEPVALETVYETIVHWDEGGGKRSRRELARRIVALYTTPPAAQWVGLTDEQISQIIVQCKITLVNYCSAEKQKEFARAIEAAHGIGEKNT